MQDQLISRVVLIGGSGFIGKAITNVLEQEKIDFLSIGSSEINLIESQSIEKLSQLLRPSDSVVMLSALTPDRGKDAATLIKNIAMMDNLLAALREIGCAHLIYFSSDAVYNAQAATVNEQTTAVPSDLYGLMHRTREHMGSDLGVPYLVLRPTLVYGESDSHNAYGPNRFMRLAQTEKKIRVFGRGEELRDHIYVGDIANLTVESLKRHLQGVFNLATGISTSFLDIAKMVSDQFGDVEIEELKRASPIWHRHFDVTHLIKAFPGFQFTKLKEKLKSMDYSQ
jgi:nucleoside-diphosphate-sugar epimerase